MPPRKKQQYFARRRRAPSKPDRDQQGAQQAVDHAARELLSAYGPAELRALVEQRREACRRADEMAQAEPTTEALRRYHAAARILAEAERALSLLDADPGGAPG